MGSRAKPACSSGAMQWLDADAQWETLEDTIYSVTRSIDKGAPVHQAIMCAFEEATASESNRSGNFLQGALEYDLMLMMKAPSAGRSAGGFENMLQGPASGASCHSGDSSLGDGSEASDRSFSRNAHRDWDSVAVTQRVACSEPSAGCRDAAAAPGSGQSSGGCPEKTETSQVSSKWKRFKERARRGMRLSSGTSLHLPE